MRVVTRLTGLSADTIRVWERRYGAVRPERTSGNARRYSSDAIRRLGLLREAIARGHSIGEIAALPDREIEGLVESAVGEREAVRSTRWSPIVDAYLEALSDYDLRRADEVLTRTAVLASPRELALDVIAPLMREVGDRWQHGVLTVAQEHVASTQCRSILGTSLRVGAIDPGAPRIVLAAPAGHDHDIGLMVASVIAASRGVVPVHLGADVPWEELIGAANRAGAEVVVLGMARDVDGDELRRATAEVKKLLDRGLEVWIGCPPGHPIARADARAIAFHDYAPLDAAITHRFSRAG